MLCIIKDVLTVLTASGFEHHHSNTSAILKNFQVFSLLTFSLITYTLWEDNLNALALNTLSCSWTYKCTKKWLEERNAWTRSSIREGIRRERGKRRREGVT